MRPHHTPNSARSLSLGHCRIGTGEKFAGCLTAYRSGFELLVAAIKCLLSPRKRTWQKHRTMSGPGQERTRLLVRPVDGGSPGCHIANHEVQFRFA